MKQENLNYFKGDGKELAQLFDPRYVCPETNSDGRLVGTSGDILKALVTDVRKELFTVCAKEGCQEHIINRSGDYEITGLAAEAIHRVGGGVASLLAHPNDVRLPDVKPERQALAHVMIESALHHQGRQHVIAPVCPDYSSGINFYRTMGEGVSPEALAAINATKILKAEYAHFMEPSITILVADTEDDIPEIMTNTARGDRTIYKAKCEASAQAIRSELKDIPGVQVCTFTQFLGSEFYRDQKACEERIRSVMDEDSIFNAKVTTIAQQRVARHSQILARPEQAYELTVRYMAQYMALGQAARETEGPTLLMNYQTPNRAFYNAAVNIHPALHLPDRITQETVPVLGTIAVRH